MKGSEKSVSELQKALHSELIAIHQYTLHASMFENWKYEDLSKGTWKRAYKEMEHAEKIIDRILAIEGRPEVAKPLEVKVGFNAKSMLMNDAALEKKAVADLNSAIKVLVAEGDDGSRRILEHVLADEEKHLHCLEALLKQIEDVGIENFLAGQS